MANSDNKWFCQLFHTQNHTEIYASLIREMLDLHMMYIFKSRIKLEHCRAVYCCKEQLKMLGSNFNDKLSPRIDLYHPKSDKRSR